MPHIQHFLHDHGPGIYSVAMFSTGRNGAHTLSDGTVAVLPGQPLRTIIDEAIMQSELWSNPNIDIIMVSASRQPVGIIASFLRMLDDAGALDAADGHTPSGSATWSSDGELQELRPRTHPMATRTPIDEVIRRRPRPAPSAPLPPDLDLED